MNKTKVKIICMITIVLIIIVQLCGKVKAEDNVKVAENKNYIEGEAIIILKSNERYTTLSAMKSNLNEESIWDDLTVYKELDFKENNDNKKSYSVASAQNNGEIMKYLFVKSEKYTTEEIINNLKDEVYHVQPNYKYHVSTLTNDKYIKSQWALENTGQFFGTEGLDINPIETHDDKEKVIAIMDTGIDYEHEDLKDAIWKNEDGKCGYDTVNDDDDPFDDCGHGTNCAGIIAATSNNEKGITGALLNNKNIKIMALKAGDEEGNLNDEDIIEAFQYILERQEEGVDIVAVNCSFGCELGEYSETDIAFKNMADKVAEKGALTVCASGNETLDNDKTCYYPAGLDSSNIIAVASTDCKDKLSKFSNYGKETVDLAAPGDCVATTSNKEEVNTDLIIDELEKYKFYEENFDSKDSLVCGVDYEVYISDEGEENYEKATEENAIVELVDLTSVGGKGKGIKLTIKNPNKLVSIRFPVRNIEPHYYLASYDAFYSNLNGRWVTFNGGGFNFSEEDNADEIFDVDVTSWDSEGDYIIYVDNLKLYKLDSQPIEMFPAEKYSIESGTSISAPYVSAAIGTISNKYKDVINVTDRKNILFQAVRKVEDLEDKLVTGGTLDLSKLPASVPTLALSTEEANPTNINKKSIEVQGKEDGKLYEVKINNENWADLSNENIELEEDGKYSIQIREKNSILSNDVTYYCVLDTKAPKVSIEPEIASNQPKFTFYVSDEGTGIKDKNLDYAIVLEKDKDKVKTYKKVELVLDQTNVETDRDTGNVYNYKADVDIDVENENVFVYVKAPIDLAGNTNDLEGDFVFGPYYIEKELDTPTPTAKPTTEPTIEPTVKPTAEPTIEPTVRPTAEPTIEPTVKPTTNPTSTPTIEPTIRPTTVPSENPGYDKTPEPIDDSDNDDDSSYSWWKDEGTSSSGDDSQTKTLDDYYAEAATDKYDDIDSGTTGGKITTTSNTPSSSPKTGDKIFCCLVVLGISAIATVVLIIKKKK